MKHEKIVVCDHFWDTDKSTKCNGRYCNNCIKRHYKEELGSLENLEQWICYKCSDVCVCAACRRLRNGEEGEFALQQKGKRKRNKSKFVEEEEEEEEEEDEDFNLTSNPFPDHRFERNLRPRNKSKQEKEYDSFYTQEQISGQLLKQSPTSNAPSRPSKQFKAENNSPLFGAKNTNQQKNSHYLFDLLIQASSLETPPPKPVQQQPQQHPQQQPLPRFPLKNNTPLPQFNNFPVDNSGENVFALRQQVSRLTSELNFMRKEFQNLRSLFESALQTNENSHDSSPINYIDN